MPFFPQAYLAPEASFFQLLSELDEPRKSHCAPRRQHQTFNPKFDIVEVPQAYELFGEVPGLEQQDLSIEFSDAQTLVIKGKTERATPSVQQQQVAETTTQTEVSDTASEKSHNATVEDDYDETDTPLATPATTATAVADDNKQEEQKTAEPEAPKPKYWVAERRVGSFARSFSFSQRIEQDEVRAELKNGVLHLVVPKSQKPRKVAVQVQ